MGRQAVHLGDARKVRHGRRTDGAAGADQITVLFAFQHQLLGDDIQHCEAVLDDGIQLARKTLFHKLRQRVAVAFPRVAHGILPQGFIRALDGGRIQSFGDGTHVAVHHIRDTVWVRDDDLPRLLRRKIAELLEHIICGTEVQRSLIIGVLEAVARLQHRAVDGVLRLHKMHVARGHHHFAQRFAQTDNRLVEFLNLLDAVHHVLPQHVFVVAQRLHLKKIVISGDIFQLIKASPLHDRPVKFSRFTGRADDKALTVFVQKAARHTRNLEEIIHMRGRNDTVQIFQTRRIAYQNDEVKILLCQLTRAAKTCVHILQRRYAAQSKILDHLHVDLCQRLRVVTGAVVLKRRDLKIFTDGIQLVIAQSKIECLRQRQCVDVGVAERHTVPLRTRL